MKSVGVLAIEAFIVGLLLVLVYAIVSTRLSPLVAVFVSGAAFHIACEVTGVNAWYARTYFT
jgi:hypothetical protein